MENEIKPGFDGLYAVCFFNDKAYDEKKIQEIFGKYGQVVSVRFVDRDRRPLVFVRYKEYYETKRCLDDLSKTKALSVKMAMPSKYPPQGVPYQQARTKPFHKNFKHGSGKIRNVHPKLGDHHSENGNFSKNVEGTKQINEVPKNEDPVYHKTVNRHTDHGSDDDTQSIGDTEGKVNGGNRDVQRSDKERSVKSLDNRGQMLQNSHTTNGIIDDGPPPLIASEDLPDDVDEEPKMYAKDVIIANLPPSVDEYDVVRLARRHDLYPVHVSAIETTGIKYNIPFCHLWMETDYEAEMAEVMLQGTRMEGKTLLVARAEKLLSAFRDSSPTFGTS